ncbi:MAG: bifunctional phosphoglucose/phosphomannose isomerase [Bacteroidota bacterium]|nr:bifunctional phosphoglucose/phosphomannose isomerase [Bacteroidota bacterium]
MYPLDYRHLIEKYDPTAQYEVLRAFPDQVRVGIAAVDRLKTGWPKKGAFRSVLIAGMGGSAIVGDALRCFAESRSPYPISLRRDYRLPAWVGNDTLLIAVSYSGTTEETLAVFEEAASRGCPRIVIASGGVLAERAEKLGVPLIRIPSGYAPRFAFGYLFFAILRLAEVLGIVTLRPGEVEGALGAIAEAVGRFSDWNDPGNPAVALAERLHGFMPVIYAANGLLEAVALRWRGQIEENAKTLAYGNVLPEMNHNEIVGWEKNPEILKRIFVIALADPDDHPAVKKRMMATLDMIRPLAAGIHTIESTRPEPLARLCELICLGDWVSYYLAVGIHVDPYPIRNIVALKDALGRLERA